ncbi:MAG: GvpL/GvpF family gas vesicle protein [Phycisphaerales bacterium]
MYAYAIVRERDVARLEDVPDLDGVPLRAISSGTLAMLVSEGAPTASDPVRYMDAVRAISDRATAIPLRASHAPTDETSVAATLRAGAARFESMLDRFDGAREWSVRFDPGEVSEEHATSTGTSAGADYLRRERLRLAEQDGIDPSAARAASDAAPLLAPLVREVRLLPTRDAGACLALLVPLDREDELRAHCDNTLEGFGKGLTLMGPWPPFSFTSPG